MSRSHIEDVEAHLFAESRAFFSFFTRSLSHDPSREVRGDVECTMIEQLWLA